MKILFFQSIQGPNVYHSQSVLVMRLDLGPWTEVGSHLIPDFQRQLVALLPGLSEHTCSLGKAGGFLSRLEKGTYPAHIVEHVAIEICNLAGMAVSFGKTRWAGKPGHYDVVLRSLNDLATEKACRRAVAWVQDLLLERSPTVGTEIQEIRKIFESSRLGPSGQCLLQAAQKKGIPHRFLGSGSLLQLGWGKHRRRLNTAISDRTSLIASEIVQDKCFTKDFLRDFEIPVPPGVVVREESELRREFERMKGPVVIKPVDGHHGEGVEINLQSEIEALEAFQSAQKYCKEVLLEEMCPGNDYRLLVIGGRLAAAAQRFPPQVQGDGVSTVEQMIAQLNLDPRRGVGHDSALTRIEVDEAVMATLRKQNLDLLSIPPKGQTVYLRNTANLSSGGTAREVTEIVHPAVRALCERVARMVDLDICGIDVIADGLGHSPNSTFKVIEVNAGPGLRMHWCPQEGKARNVGEDILDMMYPDGTPSRIPVVAVTGTNGKTTIVRLIHKIFSANSVVGMTTSDGVWIGSQKITSGDSAGPASAQMVLSDPLVEKAVLEVARGGILRGGLAYDWADVAVVSNIRADHIGQDGIEDIEDLVWIKSLVAERVHPDGFLVLNADDEESLGLQKSPRVLKNKKHFFLYSLRSDNPALMQHLHAGGSGAWLEQGWLFLQHHKVIQRLVAVQNLNFTLQGKASFQIANALAAVCASAAMGANESDIIEGLVNFEANAENRGRLNLYRLSGGYLVLDYGHNPDAIEALGEWLSSYSGFRKTLIFGLPGDRTDEIVRMAAARAGRYFDRFVLRDDRDLRGRQPGEIPALAQQEIRRLYPHKQVSIASSEKEALDLVLLPIQDNDLVVVIYESIDDLMPLIRQFDPTPVKDIFDFPGEIIEWEEDLDIRQSAMERRFT